MNPLRALFLSLSRMPPALMLLIIVGLAVFVTYAVQSELGKSQRAAKEVEEALKAKYEQKSRVVYAIKAIPEGATISADSLEEREIDAGKAPQDALPSASMAVGRIAKYGIPDGQIVSQRELAPVGVSVGFEGKIKEGMRAVTFPIDQHSGVAGFVAPGSHVDILVTAGSGDDTNTKPILSDVEVIAVGQTFQRTSGQTGAVPATSITILVSPDDAQKLVKAIMAGKLYLTLRNDKDHTPVAVVDVSQLFEKRGSDSDMAALPPPASLPPPPLPGGFDEGGGDIAPPPPPPLHEIEVWSGSKKDVLSVPKG